MGITNGAGIAAAQNDARRITCDAAGITGSCTGVEVCQCTDIHSKFQIDIGGVDGGIHTFRIHIHCIFAGFHLPHIVPCNAAGGFFSHEKTFCRALQNGSAVHSCNAANVFGAFHRAGESHVFQSAAVIAHDTADKPGIPGGGNGSSYIQIFYNSSGLQVTEQT